jgi:4-hydroxy-tetrahydrodipicolinate synthase
MKDSSGDWNNTKVFLDAFAKSGFDMFVGSESFLLANMREGGAGCISATANVNPGPIDQLYREWQSSDAQSQQDRLNSIRKATGQYIMIPALTAVIAHFAKDPQWTTVRPPLVELTKEQAAKVVADLEALDFEMPDLRKESLTV